MSRFFAVDSDEYVESSDEYVESSDDETEGSIEAYYPSVWHSTSIVSEETKEQWKTNIEEISEISDYDKDKLTKMINKLKF